MTKEWSTTAQVTRQFDEPAERVFDAWLQPEVISQWLFTSPESDPSERIVDNDVRVGGTYFIQDRRDGNVYQAKGEYLEIDRPHRLVFTFQMPQFSESTDRVIVEIQSLDTGCQLTLIQEITLPSEADKTMDEMEELLSLHAKETEQGWSEMFQHLTKKLYTWS